MHLKRPLIKVHGQNEWQGQDIGWNSGVMKCAQQYFQSRYDWYEFTVSDKKPSDGYCDLLKKRTRKATLHTKMAGSLIQTYNISMLTFLKTLFWSQKKKINKNITAPVMSHCFLNWSQWSCWWQNLRKCCCRRDVIRLDCFFLGWRKQRKQNHQLNATDVDESWHLNYLGNKQ